MDRSAGQPIRTRLLHAIRRGSGPVSGGTGGDATTLVDLQTFHNGLPRARDEVVARASLPVRDRSSNRWYLAEAVDMGAIALVGKKPSLIGCPPIE